MVFSRKQESAKFELDTELAEDISRNNIRQNPAMLDAAARTQKLRAELAELEKEIECFYRGPHSPTAMPARDTDAARIFTGQPLEGMSRDTQLKTLRRKADATRTAIEMALSEIVQLEGKLSREACDALEPRMKTMETRTLELFAELKKQLEKQEAVYQCFSRNGMPEGKRKTHWVTTSLELQLLYGGQGFPCLAKYLELRRGFWDIKQPETRKKN